MGAVSVDRAIGKPRSRLVLVNAQSGHETWSAEDRNSNCCGTPAVGFLPASRQVFASGDELLLVPLGGGLSRHVELNGVTLDAATAAGRVLAGVVQVRPGAVEHEVVAVQANGALWRTRHSNLTAVALSPDGLAAAAGSQAVAILDAGTGRPFHQVPLTGTRFASLAFFPGALLVVAQKTTAGDLQVTGLDARTGRRRWSLGLGPTTVPAVHVAGRSIVISDLRGRTGAVISSSGIVQERWTDAQGPAFVAGSPKGEIAVAVGPHVTVRTPSGRVRWRGTVPGTVFGLRFDGQWLAGIGAVDEHSNVPDRVWFFRTDQAAAGR